MINLFQISAQDQSVLYLGQIFGLVGTVIPVTDPPLLMSILFKTLNTMVLTIGVFIVVYVTVVGLLKTAQEGEFLGRQWNSVWVPIRMVMGIAALFPTTSGYAAIQVIMMWLIMQGVGAADAVWTAALKYTSIAGSPYATANASLQVSSTANVMQTLFQSLMCQASAKASYPATNMQQTTTGTLSYYCGDPANANTQFCLRAEEDMLNPISGSQVDTTKNIYGMGPASPEGGGYCGTLGYCNAGTDPNDKTAQCVDPNSLSCLSCKAQQSALQVIVPALGAVAKNLVEIDYQYVQFYQGLQTITPDWVQNYCIAKNIPPSQCCNVAPAVSGLLGQPPVQCTSQFNNFSDVGNHNDLNNASNGAMIGLYLKYPLALYLNGADFINSAVGEYTAALVSAVSTNIQNQMNNNQPIASGWEADAQKYGWAMAGSYFYRMAEMNQTQQNAVAPLLYIKSSDPNVDANTNPMKNYRNNYAAVGSMIQNMTETNNSNSATFSNVPGAGNVSSAISGDVGSLFQTFTNDMTNNKYNGGSRSGGNTNPLISIATFGYQMMIVAQLIFSLVVVAIFGISLASNINPIALGTGLTLPPWGEAIKAVLMFLSPFLIGVIIAIYALGALLGVYVPFIPYMIFTVGVLGWLMATIEAMVAAPFLALGILSPGGQHDILGRAEPALLITFNLILRPALMVIGLMAAMLLSVVAIEMINTGFSGVAESIISHPGLFEQIAFIAVYTSLVVTVLNKTFSLIYALPERVLTGLGGHAIQYGEQEAVGATKQSVEGAASQVSGAGKESTGTVATGVQSTKIAQKNETDKAAAAAAKLAESKDDKR